MCGDEEGCVFTRNAQDLKMIAVLSMSLEKPKAATVRCV